MASIILKNVNKTYNNDTVVVPNINLEIKDKEFIILVGPSGCGKSTTLRMIAGLEEITNGELWIGDRLVNDVPSKDRDIAMVFQNYALYPHMTVFQNMGFGLELRKVDKEKVCKRVTEVATILDIEHLLNRKPKALSGGQRQRVALGRAMVRDPEVFLLAAKKLGVKAEDCIVFEDAVAGIEAANAAKMISIGIGDENVLSEAQFNFTDFTKISTDFIKDLRKN